MKLTQIVRDQPEPEQTAYFVIRSSIDFGSKMNVGRVTLFRSAPGRNCDMICESTTKPRALQYSHQHP